MVLGMNFVESADELTRWATSAKTGHRVCYYRGWLMKDKMKDMPYMVKTDQTLPEYKATEKAWQLYEMGVVELFQKRMGDEDYLYIAVCK